MRFLGRRYILTRASEVESYEVESQYPAPAEAKLAPVSSCGPWNCGSKNAGSKSGRPTRPAVHS